MFQIWLQVHNVSSWSIIIIYDGLSNYSLPLLSPTAALRTFATAKEHSTANHLKCRWPFLFDLKCCFCQRQVLKCASVFFSNIFLVQINSICLGWLLYSTIVTRLNLKFNEPCLTRKYLYQPNHNLRSKTPIRSQNIRKHIFEYPQENFEWKPVKI